MSDKQTLVIYHAKCLDGFAAAYIAWKVYGDSADYLPMAYGDAVPDVTDKDVFILDFSFLPEQMNRIEEHAKSVTLLDHHQGAADKMQGYTCRCGNLFKFDMSKSGARLSWEAFFPEQPVPDLVKYVEDRDLWKWEFPETQSYLAGLGCLEKDFEDWDRVFGMNQERTEKFLQMGEGAALRYMRLCESVLVDAMPVTLNGEQGLMVNASPEMASEVAGMLAEKSGTYGMSWHLLNPTTIKVSLRSRKGFSAQALAEHFGGSGHPSAAGFTLPVSRIGELAGGSLS